MAAAEASQATARAAPEPSPEAVLSRLVYRSRAVVWLAPPDLARLVAAARARNRTEAVTGLVLYDEDRFVQWLEGPPEGIARIAASIRADPRHTDIEVLSEGPARGRRFADWDMRLAARRGAAAGDPAGATIEPTPELLDSLHRHPKAALFLLAALAPAGRDAPGRAWGDDGVDDAAAGDGGPPRAGIVLKRVALDVALPQLLVRHAPALRIAIDHSAGDAAAGLARLAASAAVDADEKVRAVCSDAGAGTTASVRLIESAARAVGDLWSEDACSEAEVAIALCRLQAALRWAGSAWPFAATRREPPPAVLVAAPPWEPHTLGAVLDTEVLRMAGWEVGRGFPATEGDLLHAVASARFDVLDLPLSPVFRRDEWLPRAARLVGDVRRASRNPRLAVVVSGRAFAEGGGAWQSVAADAGCATALRIAEAVAGALRGATMAGRVSPRAAPRARLPSRAGIQVPA